MSKQPRDRALFLSLLPTFADLILGGRKRVELRRVRPRALPGTLVIVYASSPTRAVVGGCEVSAVSSGAPDEVWELHGHLAGVDKPSYDTYFSGARHAVAIEVCRPWRLSSPIALRQLRDRLMWSNPPQSFRYVARSDVAKLLRHHHAELEQRGA